MVRTLAATGAPASHPTCTCSRRGAAPVPGAVLGSLWTYGMPSRLPLPGAACHPPQGQPRAAPGPRQAREGPRCLAPAPRPGKVPCVGSGLVRVDSSPGPDGLKPCVHCRGRGLLLQRPASSPGHAGLPSPLLPAGRGGPQLQAQGGLRLRDGRPGPHQCTRHEHREPPPDLRTLPTRAACPWPSHTQLSMPVRPSVHPSIHPSVCLLCPHCAAWAGQGRRVAGLWPCAKSQPPVPGSCWALSLWLCLQSGLAGWPGHRLTRGD